MRGFDGAGMQREDAALLQAGRKRRAEQKDPRVPFVAEESMTISFPARTK